MYLIFDVGGTFVKYALMESDGAIVEKSKIPTKNKDEDTVGVFVDSLVEIYETYKNVYKLEGIALSLPGQIDVDHGIVYVGGALPFLHEVHLADILSERCDHLPVAMENDAKCAALAEIWQGNARDCTNACLMIIGTGFGGGIVINRHVHRGNRLLAGEISYLIDGLKREDIDFICDDDKSDVVELDEKTARIIASGGCSVLALRQNVAEKKKMNIEEVTGELIYQWANAGDQIANEALKDLYFNIAKHCCNIYLIVDPDIILIGGGISSRPEFIEGINYYVNKLKKIALPYKDLKIGLCKFGNDSNLLGALYNFLQKYGLADE